MPSWPRTIGNVLTDHFQQWTMPSVAVAPRETDLLWPDPKTGPWWVKVWWRVQHGVPTPVGLSVTSWVDEEDPDNAGLAIDLPRATDDVPLPRVDGQLLRSLPVGGIVAALREQTRQVLSQERDQTGWPEEWRRNFARFREETAEEREAFSSNRRGRDLGAEHYREVAAVYAQAVQDGLPPTVAVAEHFHVEKSSAAKKVARARARGFLPKTTRGRVGPLAEEL